MPKVLTTLRRCMLMMVVAPSVLMNFRRFARIPCVFLLKSCFKVEPSHYSTRSRPFLPSRNSGCWLTVAASEMVRREDGRTSTYRLLLVVVPPDVWKASRSVCCESLTLHLYHPVDGATHCCGGIPHWRVSASGKAQLLCTSGARAAGP